MLALAALTVSLGLVGNANAQLTPPWCGTPVPDAAENLPDGTDPTDPVGSFPHIPYYAIGCTLDQIEASQLGDRMSVEVIGQSALGRPLYGVVFNAMDTPQQIQDYNRWVKYRGIALEDPARAQELLETWGDEIKVPVFVNGAIHGNEYEGVESNMQLIKELATTPYGADPKVDDILDHVILVFNVIQNPDGRVAGTRANGNGFDMNRDFLTQSQSEVRATVALIQKWLPVEVLDLHGYVTPTLIEATTKPHNPSIEYDLWLKWNQSRIDFNQAAMAGVGLNVTRPINDWCEDGSDPDPPGTGGVCADGTLPGPAVAESWDDWGPFYTPMYAQHVGLDGSTVEMCNQTGTACGLPGSTTHTRGRLGAFQAQYVVTTSSLEYVAANRNEMLFDEAERYRRGVAGEPRVDCCPAPFDVDNNWMKEFPDAYVIPVGTGQRSNAEARRLVDWLLRNGIEVDTLRNPASFDGQSFDKGSYVVWMDQAHRGLADTALNIGVDVSDRISILYAPPAAWSHGYLWGADIAEIPLDSGFSPITNRIKKTTTPDGGVEPGRAEAYALELDSATAIRTLNSLIGGGLTAEMALDAFPAKTGGTLPAGTVLFGADPAAMVKLAAAGRDNGLLFRRVVDRGLPVLDRPDRPRPADPRPHGRGQPGRLVAPEPRVPGRLHDDGFPQHSSDRSARELRRDLEHGELARHDPADRPRPPDGVLRRRRRVPRLRHRWGQLPDRRRRSSRAHRQHERRGRAQRHHPVAQRGLCQPDRRCVSRRGHVHRRPAELVHGGAGELLRGRAAPADELLPGGHVAELGVDHGSGLPVRRPRYEHRRHGSARQLRDEPALPGGSGARVADGRRGGLLGRPVDRRAT